MQSRRLYLIEDGLVTTSFGGPARHPDVRSGDGRPPASGTARRRRLADVVTRLATSPGTDDNPHRGVAVHMISWPNFVSQLFNGLALGALLALISSGLTIIYGTLGVLNLAHGAMFMLGGYAGYVVFHATGSFLARGPRRRAVPAGRRRR